MRTASRARAPTLAPGRARNITSIARRRLASRARATPTYEKVFDENTGQDVDVLSQSIERASVGAGVEWSYRRGVAMPREGESARDVPVVFVHGVGGRAYGFRSMSRELQERGFETYAPDVTGHGDSSKPSPGRGLSAYDVEATGEALVGFLEATGLAEGQVDVVAHGYVLPQHVLALAAKKPELFRRIVVMNAPLVASHAYPPQMATYTRPFGMGKGSAFDAAGYLYNGNEFAIPADVLGEYEQPYIGEEAEAARAAVEAYGV